MDYLFSEHLNSTITFDPSADRIIFDDPSIRPADVGPGDTSVSGIFTTRIDVISGPQSGSYIVLTGDVSVPQLTTTNWVFASGGVFALGDNTVSRAGDDLDNTLTGTAEDDVLGGMGGDDVMSGLGGNDLFYLAANGPSGFDTVNGGAGTDTVNCDEAGVGLVVDLEANTVSGGSTAGDGAKLSSIENFVGGGFDDHIEGSTVGNVIEGGAGDDELEGGGGNDTLIGGAGDDELDGGAGADSMVGGAGNDTYVVNSALDKVIEAVNGGNDVVITSLAPAFIANVEGVIFNGSTDVSIDGDERDNTLGGGSGDDTLGGGAGIDTVSYALAAGAVRVNLATNSASGDGADVLSGFENATGGSRADTLIGNSAANVLDGGLGADLMKGGFGNDTYIVDRLADVVNETSNSASGLVIGGGSDGQAVSGITDTVIASINYSLSSLAFVENLALSGAASTATGNALANRLTGNAGNDTLTGAGGNDTLDGGANNDRLLGGAGNDTLVWGAGDRCDGGAGTDALKVKSGSLNLATQADDRILNIETVDLRGGGNNNLTLGASDVLAINGADTLKVLGDAGDTVNAAGFHQVSDLNGFHRYTSGAATLLVDTDIAVSV